MRTLALALSLAAFSCSPPPLPPVQHVTIPDPISFLAGPAGPRNDWPLPDGYVVSESVALSGGVAKQTWDFKPFGSYETARGDGYQLAQVGPDGFVRFTETVDGGTVGVQHFVGQRCNGTGWIVFGTDAPTGTWREVVATLNIAQDPRTCPSSLNPAYTRYRLEQVAYPFAIAGALSTRTIPTVISEHYDHRTISQAGALERSYLGQGYGLLRWEAWRKTPPPIGDLPERCGPVAYSEPPAADWQLNDCRAYTNIVGR